MSTLITIGDGGDYPDYAAFKIANSPNNVISGEVEVRLISDVDNPIIPGGNAFGMPNVTKLSFTSSKPFYGNPNDCWIVKLASPWIFSKSGYPWQPKEWHMDGLYLYCEGAFTFVPCTNTFYTFSFPTIKNCLFYGTYANSYYIMGGDVANLYMCNCIFYGRNRCVSIGDYYDTGPVTVENCTFFKAQELISEVPSGWKWNWPVTPVVVYGTIKNSFSFGGFNADSCDSCAVGTPYSGYESVDPYAGKTNTNCTLRDIDYDDFDSVDISNDRFLYMPNPGSTRLVSGIAPLKGKAPLRVGFSANLQTVLGDSRLGVAGTVPTLITKDVAGFSIPDLEGEYTIGAHARDYS